MPKAQTGVVSSATDHLNYLARSQGSQPPSFKRRGFAVADSFTAS